MTTFTAAITSRKQGEGGVDGITANTSANLAVYRTNYLYALLSALERRYPCVQKFLGNDNFKVIGRDYVYSHPSRNANIDCYGDEFPQYLSARQELAPYPYLSDLARLDDIWFREDTAHQVSVARGTTTLWEKIKEEQEIGKITIDDTTRQAVSFERDAQGDACLRVVEG